MVIVHVSSPAPLYDHHQSFVSATMDGVITPTTTSLNEAKQQFQCLVLAYYYNNDYYNDGTASSTESFHCLIVE
jgi:hypothetical protein